MEVGVGLVVVRLGAGCSVHLETRRCWSSPLMAELDEKVWSSFVSCVCLERELLAAAVKKMRGFGGLTRVLGGASSDLIFRSSCLGVAFDREEGRRGSGFVWWLFWVEFGGCF